MPALGVLRPSSAAPTPMATQVPMGSPKPGVNGDNALSKLCQALLEGIRRPLSGKPSTYLVVITGVVLFGTVFCAAVFTAYRRRRYRVAAIATTRCDDAKRPAWGYEFDEKNQQRKDEQLRKEREVKEQRERERWLEEHREEERQWPQEQQQQQQKRQPPPPYYYSQQPWSGPPARYLPPVPPPPPPFPPLEPFQPYQPFPPPHLLAAILPQPTLHPYRDPALCDGKTQRVVRTGVRRHVRVFGS
ncbi:MAG: hypothetical protein M1813_001741 [Trichoglossum hirsutum]|nr:MAG: hypothetical protein M1813_001741 [Trichoglossum hirsutum]